MKSGDRQRPQRCWTAEEAGGCARAAALTALARAGGGCAAAARAIARVAWVGVEEGSASQVRAASARASRRRALRASTRQAGEQVPAVQGPAGPARPRGRTSGFLAPTGGHQGSGRGTETHRQVPDRSVAPCSTRSPRCSASSSQSMGSCRAPHRSSRRASSCAEGTSSDVSLAFLGLYVAGYGLWLLYGVTIGSLPLILVNAVGLLCGAAVRWRSLCDSRGPAPRTPDSALGLATAGPAPLPAQRSTGPPAKAPSASGRACPPTSAPRTAWSSRRTGRR